MLSFSLFVLSIFLHTGFTSFTDTTLTLFSKISVTPGIFPYSHLPPQTSVEGNCRHYLPGWIIGHLEWEHIRLPGLCVVRPSSCLRNLWIAVHLEWENFIRPVLCVGFPTSRLCNIHPQIYHFLLDNFSIWRGTVRLRQGNFWVGQRGRIEEIFLFFAEQKIQCHFDCHHPLASYDSLLSL